MRYFLENSELKVEIDSFGAEIKSVLNKNNNREYMWYGNGKYWGRTSPVLFPFVGSLKDKKYTWEGRDYPMGQHGFARDNEFHLINQTDDEIRFEFKSSPATLEKYPFNFILKIGYKLIGSGETNDVQVMWEVINPDERTMYFSIGAHPAFLCPLHGFARSEKEGKGCKTGYKLYFDGVTEIHHHGNDVASGLALKEDLVLALDNGYAEITDEFFDRCTYMIEGNQTKRVGIADEEGRHAVDVCFDTPLFAIWSPEKKNAPFICIEPWYGRCDGADFEGDLSQREFTNVLGGGETFTGGYTMKFYEYYW